MLPSSQPRNLWEQIVGPGVTRAETALVLCGAFGLAGVALYQASIQIPAWNVVQIVVAVLVALDIGGGVVANAAPSAKRWYHRDGQGFRQHIGFIAAHLVHLALVAAVLIANPLTWIGLHYGFLLLAAVLILRAPTDLRLAVAVLLWLTGVLIGWYGNPVSSGLEWFLPAFYLKLLVCHLVP